MTMKLTKAFALSLSMLGTPMALGGLTTAATTLVAEPAVACDSACETAKWQASRQPFTGGTAPVYVDTCVRLLVSEDYHAKSEVVLVAGDDPLHGRVITSLGRGAGYSFRFPNQPAGTEDVFVREFCFDGSLIEGVETITFCNGLEPGDGNHHTLSMNDATRPYLERLRRTGHVGDFLTLLGIKRSYAAPVSTFFTERKYQNMF